MDCEEIMFKIGDLVKCKVPYNDEGIGIITHINKKPSFLFSISIYWFIQDGRMKKYYPNLYTSDDLIKLN